MFDKCHWLTPNSRKAESSQPGDKVAQLDSSC
jgi:hypothetical protein